MAIIALESMRFQAQHGVYAEETVIGNAFEMDVWLETNIVKAAESDDLAKTINYQTIYDICRFEMSKPQKLLETVVQNISQSIKKQFSNIQSIRIRLRKLQPPLGGVVQAVSVEISEQYGKKCPRCGKDLICYNDKNCWCNTDEVQLHSRTREQLALEFKGCLCSDCLKFYAG